MRDKKSQRHRVERLESSGDKKPRFPSQLSDEQLLILGLLLVVLLVVSMLYCLGFASLAVLDNWQRIPLPSNGTVPAEELLDTTATMQPTMGTTPP